MLTLCSRLRDVVIPTPLENMSGMLHSCEGPYNLSSLEQSKFNGFYPSVHSSFSNSVRSFTSHLL